METRKESTVYKFCEECGFVIDSETNECPNCSEPRKKEMPWRTKFAAMWVAIGVLALLLIFSIIACVNLYNQNVELTNTIYELSYENVIGDY